jgi:hypothetical protein
MRGLHATAAEVPRARGAASQKADAASAESAGEAPAAGAV